MKNLFFVIAMFLSLTMYAGPTVDSAQITQAERIIDKYSGKIYNVLGEVATELKGPAKEMFNAVIKLEIAKGLGMLIPLFVAFFFLYLFRYEYNSILHLLNSEDVPKRLNSNYGPFDESNVTAPLIIYLILFLGFTVFAIGVTYNGIMHLVAPEWYAIQDILKLLK